MSTGRRLSRAQLAHLPANNCLTTTSIVVTLLQSTQGLLSLEQIALPSTCTGRGCFLSNTRLCSVFLTLGYRNGYFHFTAAGSEVTEEAVARQAFRDRNGELGLEPSCADTMPSAYTVTQAASWAPGAWAPHSSIRACGGDSMVTAALGPCALESPHFHSVLLPQPNCPFSPSSGEYVAQEGQTLSLCPLHSRSEEKMTRRKDIPGLHGNENSHLVCC